MLQFDFDWCVPGPGTIVFIVFARETIAGQGSFAMRRFLIWAVVLSAAVAAGGVLLVWVKTERTLKQSRAETVEAAKIAFDYGNVQATDAGFSELDAPSAYTAAAEFQGKMVLAGPGGLRISSLDGAGARVLRTGVELPPVAITGLAVGVVRGDARARLVVATRGEGLLLLDSDDASGRAIRQLRPRDAALRDVTAVAVLASGSC